MGLRGPAPTSAAELKLHGDFRADRHAERENIPPPVGEPIKPKGLSGAALAHWKQIVPLLMERQTVGTLDSAALQTLCETWALKAFTHTALKRRPIDKDTRIAYESYSKLWLTIAAKMGLTTLDRQRILTNAGESKPQGVTSFARKRGAS